MDNLRRLRRDPTAPGWRSIKRLLRPLDAVAAGLDSPLTTHRRRAVDEALAVLLLRCGQVGLSYWGWTVEEWTQVIFQDQECFRRGATAWADEAVSPYLSATAYLLGRFHEFNQLGSLSRSHWRGRSSDMIAW